MKKLQISPSIASVAFAFQVFNQCLFSNEQGLDKLLPEIIYFRWLIDFRELKGSFGIYSKNSPDRWYKGSNSWNPLIIYWKIPSLNVRFLFLQRRQENIYTFQSDVSGSFDEKCRWNILGENMKCPSCGNNELQQHHRFCSQCGCRLDDKPTEAPKVLPLPEDISPQTTSQTKTSTALSAVIGELQRFLLETCFNIMVANLSQVCCHKKRAQTGSIASEIRIIF